MKHITIYGAGAYGTALASVLEENGHKITFYDPYKYPDIDLLTAGQNSDISLLVTPAVAVPEILPSLPKDKPLILASKGFLSLKPFADFGDFQVLSGGAFAEDILAKKPTKLTITSSLVAGLFITPWLTLEHTPDKLGVMICGSLKNIYAIGAGLYDFHAGTDNFEHYIHSAIDEIRLILSANHCDPLTASLSCGEQDLRLTCGNDERSRNYAYGAALRRHPGAQPTATTEGLSAIHSIETTPEFVLPNNDQLILIHQVIKHIKEAQNVTK